MLLLKRVKPRLMLAYVPFEGPNRASTLSPASLFEKKFLIAFAIPANGCDSATTSNKTSTGSEEYFGYWFFTASIGSSIAAIELPSTVSTNHFRAE